ncbi:MAG: hypothetical protein AAFR61_26505 [Bacteroidota bacterium]
MKSLTTILLLLGLVFSESLLAQPSDAQIRKDLMNPGIISMKLSNTGGKKVWSSIHAQYFWERGVVIVRNAKIAEYPKATVEIGGISRYHITNGRYSYREFKVMWNEYKGIPTPSDEEIVEMARQRLKQILRNRYNSIVGPVENLRIADEKKTEWHTPKSFSINYALSYPEVVSYTEVAQKDVIHRVRFYRDEVTSPWKENVVGTVESETTTSKTTYTAEEIRAMPSLADIEQEAAATEALAGLPPIEIPAFQSDIEVFMFVHQILLQDDPKLFEAMMMRMMAPHNFVEGSTTRLNQNGANLINTNLKRAFEGKSSYSQQYCQDPAIKHRQKNMVQFLNKSKQVYTRIALGQYGGRYERGVKVDQEYKINALSIVLLSKQDDLDYMNSFPQEELCPSDGLSTAGTAREGTEEATEATPAEATAATTAGLAGPGGLPAAAAVWEGIDAPDAYFQVDLPGEVTLDAAEMNDGNMRYVYAAQDETGMYQIIAYALPGRYNTGQKRQMIESMAKNFMSRNSAVQRRSSDLMMGQHPGRLYLLRRGTDGRMSYRVFVSDHMLYEMVYSTTEKAYKNENERKFFNSFSLTQ